MRNFSHPNVQNTQHLTNWTDGKTSSRSRAKKRRNTIYHPLLKDDVDGEPKGPLPSSWQSPGGRRSVWGPSPLESATSPTFGEQPHKFCKGPVWDPGAAAGNVGEARGAVSGAHTQAPCSKSLSLPRNSSVTLGRSLCPSVPQFSLLLGTTVNSTYLIVLTWKLSKLIVINLLEHCLCIVIVTLNVT